MNKLQGKVPQVRFPEFKDAWEQKTIGDVFDLNARPINKPLDNYKSIGIRSHFKGTFQRLDSDPSKNVMDTLFEVKENDLIVNITFAWEGAVAIASKDDEGGLVSHRFPTYINDKSKVEIDFFRFLFPTPEFKRTLTLISPGSAGRNRVLKKSDFLKIKFLFPTLPEQTRIASFFTVLDKKIAELKQKKNLLEQYKKGVTQKLFSQEFKFKDENGKEFPKWENKKLGNIAQFSKGKGISKVEISEEGKYECIRYGELYTHYGETISEIQSRTDLKGNELVFSENNDVIIPASGESQIDIAKASCVLKSGVALGGDINIMKGEFDGVFLSYYLNHKKRNEIATLAQGVSVVHLYSSQLSTLELQLPSLKEQNLISKFISIIENKINRTENQIQQTQEYKKGLLQNMFCE